jgi:predicted DCC family thiol-disulfide oxidoreductase YuxK
MSTADPTATPEIVIQGTHGTDDPEKATLPFIVGNNAGSAIPSRARDRLVFDPSWLGDVPPPARPLLMFDGRCPFCRAAARLVARVDHRGRLALLSRDDDAAAPYAARIPEHEFWASWQLIEPTGLRMMHGPAAIRLIEHVPATRWLGWTLRTLRLTPLVTAVNRLLGRIRRPLSRFFRNPRVPRRWP